MVTFASRSRMEIFVELRKEEVEIKTEWKWKTDANFQGVVASGTNNILN